MSTKVPAPVNLVPGPVAPFVPPLPGFRIKSGLTIPAPVLILGDIVDRYFRIPLVLFHT